MDEHLTNNPNDPLPIVFPLVLYAGKESYTATTDIFELFGENKELAKSVMFKPHLVD